MCRALLSSCFLHSEAPHIPYIRAYPRSTVHKPVQQGSRKSIGSQHNSSLACISSLRLPASNTSAASTGPSTLTSPPLSSLSLALIASILNLRQPANNTSSPRTAYPRSAFSLKQIKRPDAFAACMTKNRKLQIGIGSNEDLSRGGISFESDRCRWRGNRERTCWTMSARTLSGRP